MNPILLYSLIGAGALILFSYGKTAKKLADLKVSLYNPLKVHNSAKDIITSNQIILNLSLRIVNSGTNTVTINDISGLVEKQSGGLLATFVKKASQDAWVIKPQQAIVIENLMVNIELWDAVEALRPILKDGLPIKVSGTLTAEGNAIPFALSDEIKVDLTQAMYDLADWLESKNLRGAAKFVKKGANLLEKWLK